MLNSRHSANSSLQVFWPFILVAIALHFTVAFTLAYLNPSLLDKKDKTIPILLLSADTKANKSSKQSSSSAAQRTAAAKEFLSTMGKSDFASPTKTEVPGKNNDASPLTTRSTTATNLPSFPAIATPNQTQATRAQQARKGLHNIFAQQQQTSNEIKQLSTRSASQLNEYELLLVKRLVRADLYDQYHAIMESNGKNKVDFEIVLILFQNGAIKNAAIKKSSDIKEIDKLGIRTAYNASPYPAPPKKDIQRGFRYSIPISYHKQK